MTRSMLVAMVLSSGCSLIVPSPGDFTADLVDGGQAGRDGGTDAGRDAGRDAGPGDAGVDAGPACEPGLTECGGDCVDTQSDLAHCGGCDNACAATDRCREGACFDPVVEIATGPRHTCARRATGAVVCWGSNASGQLGNGTVADSPVPVPVALAGRSLGLAGAGTSLVEAAGKTCSRQESGEVWCWGDNESGELGNGTVDPQLSPVRVGGLPLASDVSLATRWSCATTISNRLYCWGASLPDAGMVVGPTELSPIGSGGWALSLDVGAGHGCAVSTFSGRAYCWGQNGVGQLGNGETEFEEQPVEVLGLTGEAIDVAVSAGSSCALLSDGQVNCWGFRYLLGNGDTTSEAQSTAVLVDGLEGVVAIDASSFGETTCVVHGPDRTVSCWGRDIIETTRIGRIEFPGPRQHRPTPLSGFEGIVSVAVEGAHICAIREDGTVVCVGLNSHGQLGDGTMEDRLEPTPVLLP